MLIKQLIVKYAWFSVNNKNNQIVNLKQALDYIYNTDVEVFENKKLINCIQTQSILAIVIQL